MKELLLKLENGMRVCLLPNREVGSIAVYLKGLAGSNYETLANVGASHLLEHLVLKGSQNFLGERDLLNPITDEGGKYIGVTSRDDVLFGTHTLSGHLEKSLLFLSEIFYRPLLRDKDISEVKALMNAEISRCFDNPEKLVSRLAYESLFPSSRLAKFNIGDIDDLKNLNIDKIRNFHKQFYTNNRFVLVISGNFTVKNVKQLLKKYFSVHTNVSEVESAINISSESITRTHNKYNFSQDYIRVDFKGFKTSDNKKYAAQILAKYLSAAVKNEAQLAGVAYKTEITSYTSHDYGVFSFYGSCPPESLERLVKIFATAAKNMQNKIDKNLMESSKKSIIANLLFALEKPSMRAEYYSDLILHGATKQKNHKYEIDQIKKVAMDMILKTAKKTFAQNPKVTLISNRNNSSAVSVRFY